MVAEANSPLSPFTLLSEADLVLIHNINNPPNAAHVLPPSPPMLKRLREEARFYVPNTVSDAVAILGLFNIGKALCRQFLRVLNVMGANDFKIIVARHVIACKMVQRRLCFQCIDDIVHNRHKNAPVRNPQHIRITQLLPTHVRFLKDGPDERVEWYAGDMPEYDEKLEVIPSQPILHPELGPLRPFKATSEADNLTDFEPEEYCRLLHVLADPTVSSHLQELKNAHTDHTPWTKYVVPLFNDPRFEPHPVKSLSGGVSKDDIKDLLPRFVRPRDGDTLCARFAEFKTLYRASVRGYVDWGDDENDTFADYCQGRKYIMYAFCLLENYPELEPLTLQTSDEADAASDGTGDDKHPLKRAIDKIDLDDEASSMPVPKRVRAALLQENERSELKKIIEGAEPIDDQAENAPTKSEVIQQMEREEKAKAKMIREVLGDKAKNAEANNSNEALAPTVRLRTAVQEEIEIWAREKAISDAQAAKQRHINSLLDSIRITQLVLDRFMGTEERRRIHIDMLNVLYTRLAQAQRESG